MRCRILMGLLALATAAPFAAAADPKPPAGPELFPLAVGNRWTYRIVGQDDKLVVTAAGYERVGNVNTTRLEGRLRDRLIASEHVAARKEGALRYRNDGADIDPPLPICKFPPARYLTWEAEYKVGDKKTAIAYECDEQEVEVPAGKYHAISVHSEITEGAMKLKNTCWYAPRVGLVKQLIEDGDSRIVLELEKFERAPPFTKKKE
jgi:hypothetical protein